MDILLGDNGGRQGQGGGAAKREPRPFVGIHFKCCGVYCRIYRNKAETAYEGACPMCHKKVRLAIGEGGTSKRFFEAT